MGHLRLYHTDENVVSLTYTRSEQIVNKPDCLIADTQKETSIFKINLLIFLQYHLVFYLLIVFVNHKLCTKIYFYSFKSIVFTKITLLPLFMDLHRFAVEKYVAVVH